MRSPYTQAGAVLSARTMQAVEAFSHHNYQLPVFWLNPLGDVVSPAKSDPALELPALRDAIRDALHESHRWGEPFIFFLCPGLIAWVIPLGNLESFAGGMLTGCVLVDEADRAELAVHLQECGLDREDAGRFADRRPVWGEGQPRLASAGLYQDFYTRSGWLPVELLRRRENAAQQRQIAEEIHSRKGAITRRYPIDEERRLMAMIRIGDRKAARGVLNQLLAALFVHAPGLPALRARAVELMGYLVRAALDDNPLLEPMMDQSQQSSERLVEARTFDELCIALRDSLDSFIESAASYTATRGNPAVRKALDYIGSHYTEPIALAEVAEAAGLSSYRVAHLIKEATGRTVMQQVRILRITKAKELLEETSIGGAELAAQLGFHDQSHFIREFRSLTGTTPSRYRNGSRTGQTMPATPPAPLAPNSSLVVSRTS